MHIGEAYKILDPNTTDAQVDEIIERSRKRRKKRHEDMLELIHARFAHEREMLEIKQQPSRLMDFIHKD